ncbi:hypothetical protein E3N88_31547 [Mikania micrantha]|uniref:Uncharacterized protein n=1 Tax=Mikania micrantha TaxID=192012 RepID=A0A5N6MQ73_9ASTR|nr:hypothetical protein E3N88_31547 [Mikania micrantha]
MRHEKGKIVFTKNKSRARLKTRMGLGMWSTDEVEIRIWAKEILNAKESWCTLAAMRTAGGNGKDDYDKSKYEANKEEEDCDEIVPVKKKNN